MKPFWKSKTVWANVLAIAMVIANTYGIHVPAPDPATIALVNVILRFFTDTAIS